MMKRVQKRKKKTSRNEVSFFLMEEFMIEDNITIHPILWRLEVIRSSVFFIWFSWLDRFKVFVNVMGGFNLDNHDMGKNKREEEEAAA